MLAYHCEHDIPWHLRQFRIDIEPHSIMTFDYALGRAVSPGGEWLTAITLKDVILSAKDCFKFIPDMQSLISIEFTNVKIEGYRAIDDRFMNAWIEAAKQGRFLKLALIQLDDQEAVPINALDGLHHFPSLLLFHVVQKTRTTPKIFSMRNETILQGQKADLLRSTLASEKFRPCFGYDFHEFLRLMDTVGLGLNDRHGHLYQAKRPTCELWADLSAASHNTPDRRAHGTCYSQWPVNNATEYMVCPEEEEFAELEAVPAEKIYFQDPVTAQRDMQYKRACITHAFVLDPDQTRVLRSRYQKKAQAAADRDNTTLEARQAKQTKSRKTPKMVAKGQSLMKDLGLL
jgi:hypothetical protein